MSIQAVGWVLRHERETSGINRLVLLALANYADENGEAYPSVKRLAGDCNCSERAVQYAIKELEGMGLLVRSLNAATDGRIPKGQKPNVYRITPPADSAPEGCNPEQEPVQTTTFTGADVCTQTVIGTIKNRQRRKRHFLPGSGWVEEA